MEGLFDDNQPRRQKNAEVSMVWWYRERISANQAIPVSKACVLGLTPSPAILASTIKHYMSKYEEKELEVTSLLSSSLYVDDLVGGVFRENESANFTTRHRKSWKMEDSHCLSGILTVTHSVRKSSRMKKEKAGQLWKPLPKKVNLHIKISTRKSHRAPKMVNWKQNN